MYKLDYLYKTTFVQHKILLIDGVMKSSDKYCSDNGNRAILQYICENRIKISTQKWNKMSYLIQF